MTKEEQFVNELIGYIFAYPDDDYMTMECLCRKLHKYGLIDKKDGEWTTDFIDRKTEPTSSKMEQVDEPQTDCGDFADRLAYERGVKHAWEVAQKVFNSTVTFYEAEDVAKQIDKDINVRSKDEPQTCEECEHWSDTEDGCADRHGCTIDCAWK